MSQETYIASVGRLSRKELGVGELLTAAAALHAAGEAEQAMELYRLWIGMNANDPLLYVVLFNYSVMLSGSGDLAGSKEALERCIGLNPDFAPAYINLGGAYERLGAAGAAIDQWAALSARLAPVTGSAINYRTTALKQIGRVLETHQQVAKAESILRQSLEINPHQPDVIQHFISHRLAQCEWPIVSPFEGVERKVLMKGIGPLSMSVYTDDPLLQLACAWNYNKHIIGYPPLSSVWEHRPPALAEARAKRRRVGYVSSDLRHHAVGFIMAELFELHDRAACEVFVYYCGIPHEDPLKARIRDAVEHWTDIGGMSDEAAAEKIAADDIDILVDVNGYTKDARTKIFALRPAPILVNWLGYPGSMGSPYHHYIIADDWIIPEGSERYYSEKVMRLPCYQPNDRKREVASVAPSRASAGLPEDALVLCCFNGAQKIGRFMFERWLAILERVPGSVLWLLEGLEMETTGKRLRDFAAARGVAPERIIFAAKMPNPEHLARYPLADLFLDTAPYGAHVTASDALWMGVPVVTLSGRSFASRVCGSLLRSAGLPDLVCASPEEYIEKAVAIANDRAEIARLKQRLAANRDSCVLFDTESTARHLEGLYKQMWKEYEQGHLPRPDLSNLDLYLEAGAEIDHDATELLTVKDYHGLYQDRFRIWHAYAPIRGDTRLWPGGEDGSSSYPPAPNASPYASPDVKPSAAKGTSGSMANLALKRNASQKDLCNV